MDLNEIIYNFALGIPGLLLAVVCHEVARGYVATRYGDPTPQLYGRLTLNPSVHIDILGCIIIPLIGAIMGGPLFGWAKPVPVDYRFFKKKIRQATFMVSFAGPAANMILVILSSLVAALIMVHCPPTFYLYDPLTKMCTQSIYINTIIGVFNLLPIPPLSGSKMLTAYMSYDWQKRFDEIGRYSFFIFLALIYLGPGLSNYIFMPALYIAQRILEIFIHLV